MCTEGPWFESHLVLHFCSKLMNENCYPKLGKIEPKQFQNPGLSLRGKKRTQNRSPNEEKNKNINTNVHIGSLVVATHNCHSLLFCKLMQRVCNISVKFNGYDMRDQTLHFKSLTKMSSTLSISNQ